MPNWCNNYLDLLTKEKPTWVDADLVWDDALELPNADHYAFGADISCMPGDKCWRTMIHFQTKWSPPIEFYQWLLDEGCLDIYADYSEPGSCIYGKFDMNWHDERSWPDTFYSEMIDMTIHLTVPPQLFMDVVQDEYCLFEEILLRIEWMK